MMKKTTTAATAVAIMATLAAGPALAQKSSTTVARELGSLLASEAYCGLAYDQAAVAAYIDAQVDPSEMGFASTLEIMISGAEYDLDGKSPSAKTAHCSAVTRSARHYGFIE